MKVGTTSLAHHSMGQGHSWNSILSWWVSRGGRKVRMRNKGGKWGKEEEELVSAEGEGKR